MEKCDYCEKLSATFYYVNGEGELRGYCWKDNWLIQNSPHYFCQPMQLVTGEELEIMKVMDG